MAQTTTQPTADSTMALLPPDSGRLYELINDMLDHFEAKRDNEMIAKAVQALDILDRNTLT